MKALFSIFTIAAIFTCVGAQAETVTFHGKVNQLPITLTLETTTPVPLIRIVRPDQHDEETGRIPGITEYHAVVGGATLKVAGDSVYSRILLVGEQRATGIFANFYVSFSESEVLGFVLVDPLLTNDQARVQTTADQSKVTKVTIPATLSLRWYFNARYPTSGDRNGIVTLTR